MENEKFQIQSKKYKGNTSVISIRISDDLIKQLEEVSKDTGRPRNEIICLALEYALKNVEVIK